MNQEQKKKKFVAILGKISQERREKTEKNLSDHHFHLKATEGKGNLFDYLLLSAIMEQADSMSLIFGKPHQYQRENEAGIRLGKEAYETLQKSALLRPTRLGPLTLIG